MTASHTDVTKLGVGIDVSKDTLDVAYSDNRPSFSVGNDLDGHKIGRASCRERV